MSPLYVGSITLKSVTAWWQVASGIRRLRHYLEGFRDANPGFRYDILESRVFRRGESFRVSILYSDRGVWIYAYFGYKLSASPGEPRIEAETLSLAADTTADSGGR